METSAGWLSGACQVQVGDPITDAEHVLMRAHLAHRPEWFCLACGDPWPCLVARAVLRDEYHLDRQRSVMAAFLEQAVVDLPDQGRGALFARFLGWTARDVLRARAVGSARVRTL